MADVNAFISCVSKGLSIPTEHIDLVELRKGREKGSINIVVQIPEVFVKKLRQALSRNDSWLREKKVLEGHIDGDESVTIQDYFHGKKLEFTPKQYKPNSMLTNSLESNQSQPHHAA